MTASTAEQTPSRASWRRDMLNSVIRARRREEEEPLHHFRGHIKAFPRARASGVFVIARARPPHHDGTTCDHNGITRISTRSQLALIVCVWNHCVSTIVLKGHPVCDANVRFNCACIHSRRTFFMEHPWLQKTITTHNRGQHTDN